jgi:hypothetical protein
MSHESKQDLDLAKQTKLLKTKQNLSGSDFFDARLPGLHLHAAP